MADVQAYADKLQDLTDRAFTLDAAARKAVLAQLSQAADAIRAELAKADPTSYSAARLRALKVEIARTMGQFAQAASNDVAKQQAAMASDATKSVDAVVSIGAQASGNPWPLAVRPVVDPRMIAVAQDYSADLINGLSAQTALRINTALTRGMLGGSTWQQLVEQIGGALDGGAFSGVFSLAGERAATIATNEVLRMHSLASMARMKDLASRHAGIEKEWMHTPVARVPRLAHIAANGQTKPVDEPFLVGGEGLMYPRDPSGSPGNTINCHCLVRPKLSVALLKPSAEQRAILDRYGISVTTTRN